MSAPDSIAEILLTDFKIVIHQSTIKPLGGLASAAIFAQLAYWSERARGTGEVIDGERWAFRTQAQLEAETDLSPRQQRLIRQKLVELGVLRERLHGVPARLYYQIDFAKFAEIMQAESAHLDVPKRNNWMCGIDQSNNRETYTNGISEVPNGTFDGARAQQAKPAKVARQLPDDFVLTPDRLAYAAAQGMTDRLARLAFQRFTNYWRSEGKTKKDWEATWRNWVLSDVARMTERQGGIAGSTPDYATDPEGYKAHRTALAERSRV